MASSPRQKTRISNVYKIEVPDRALGKTVVKFEVHLCRKLHDGRTVNYQRRHNTQRAAELDRVIGEIRSGTYMPGTTSVHTTANRAAPAPAPSTRNDCTVAEALQQYLAYLDDIRSGGQPYRERNRLLFIARQPIGLLPQHAMDGHALDEYIQYRSSQGLSEATVKKEIVILRRMRRLAHRPALGLDATPATICANRDLRGSNTRTRRLEGNEFERLMQFFLAKNDWQMHRMTFATHAEMKATSFEYIKVFYNRQRQHSTLGYRSPRQFLDNWVSQQQQEKQVA